MNIFVLLNILGAWYLWRWASDAFERKHESWAWTLIFFSAWNAASAANVLF